MLSQFAFYGAERRAACASEARQIFVPLSGSFRRFGALFHLAVLWWRLGKHIGFGNWSLPVSGFMRVFAQELYAGVGTIGPAPQKCAGRYWMTVSVQRRGSCLTCWLVWASSKSRPSPGGCSWTNWHGITPLRVLHM